jgi:hypothetical protein
MSDRSYLGIPAERWQNHVVINLDHHVLNVKWLQERFGEQGLLTAYDERDWVTTRQNERSYLLMRNHDDALEYILRW